MFINVAIGILEFNDRILLIKRNRGNFSGYWGLPGGKIEDGEHVDGAIIREINEETNLSVDFIDLVGVFTEIIKSKDNTISTVIYGCKVKLKDNTQKEPILLKRKYYSMKEQTILRWFSKEEVNRFRSNIIHSDLMLLEKCLDSNEIRYMKIDCFENDEGSYNWIESA